MAEVLITLGIIGVVAALTAPALTKNTGQAKIGPALSKFVNTFEVATEQLMNDRNVDKLTSEVPNAKELGGALANYIIMSPYNETFSISAPNGTASETPVGAKYRLKDGSIVVFEWLAIDAKFKGASGAFKGPIATVYVDINGNTAKGNKAGKDVFAFLIDNAGFLVPIGSNMQKQAYGGTPPACNIQGTTVAAGFGCTGKIADNNWKADY